MLKGILRFRIKLKGYKSEREWEREVREDFFEKWLHHQHSSVSNPCQEEAKTEFESWNESGWMLSWYSFCSFCYSRLIHPLSCFPFWFLLATGFSLSLSTPRYAWSQRQMNHAWIILSLSLSLSWSKWFSWACCTVFFGWELKSCLNQKWKGCIQVIDLHLSWFTPGLGQIAFLHLNFQFWRM